jgi:hypothetical protein
MAMAVDLTQQAARIGREHGIAAASMYFDGHEARHIYEETLKGIKNGDPLIVSQFPEPDLPGVWAFSYTADDLCAELGITTGIDAEAFAGCCDAYDNAYRKAACEEMAWQCRHHLAADHGDLARALALLDDDLVKLIAAILADHREGKLSYPETVSRVMDALEAHKQDDHALADRDLVGAAAAPAAS